MAIVGGDRTVRCEVCKRTMHPNRVEAGATTKVAVIVAGQLMPLKCTSCGRVVCHECQGGQKGVGASHISMFCRACDQMIDVLGYSRGADRSATDRSATNGASKGGGGRIVFLILLGIAAIGGLMYVASGR